MSRRDRGPRRVFTVVYHGERNRFIMSEDILATCIEEVELRAGRSMPPKAIRFKAIDQSQEARHGTAGPEVALRGF